MDNSRLVSREKVTYRYTSGINITEPAFSPVAFPEHWHVSAEFILALEDGVRILLEGEVYQLEKGDVLLGWPAQIHEILEAPQKGYLILQFDEELLLSSPDFSLCYSRLCQLHHFGKEDERARGFLGGKIQQCLELFRKKEPFAETKMRMLIYEMLLYVCENHLGEGSGWQGRNQETCIQIQKICNYIRLNSREKITLKDAAALSGYSPCYFSRIFKTITHESFTEYLTRHRIANAVSLLRQENLTIKEVAFQAGFQSISNFSKVFRSQMHCTPMEYRKKVQEGEEDLF